MRLKKFHYLIFISALSSCIEVTDKKAAVDKYFLERNRSMEITTLIDTLVQGYGLSDWARLSDAKEIVWKNEGLHGKDIYYKAPCARVGEVYITAGGKFSHFILEDRLKPVIWQVLLSGGFGGYTRVVLSNNVSSHEFAGFEDYFRKNKNLVSFDTIKCPDPYQGCSMYKMKLLINKRNITVFEKCDSGGNSGATVTLYFNPLGDEEMKLPDL